VGVSVVQAEGEGMAMREAARQREMLCVLARTRLCLVAMLPRPTHDVAEHGAPIEQRLLRMPVSER